MDKEMRRLIRFAYLHLLFVAGQHASLAPLGQLPLSAALLCVADCPSDAPICNVLLLC